MPEQLVRYLTYAFLALLYLFFLRVLRAVWVELREPKAAPPLPAGAPGYNASNPRGQSGYVLAPEPERSRRSRKNAPDRLRVLEPPDRAGQEFELADELTVGRAPGCSISLPDDTFVSQVHARVFRRDQDLWVEDLGSTNGTLLNERKVSAPVVMHKGDRLKVGKTVLEVTR